MAVREIRMPDIGEGITEAEITEWLVKVGDVVREDDVLAAVMTEKATVEVPSPVDGTVTAIKGEIGDIIAVGTAIVTLETSSDGAGSTEKQEEPSARNLQKRPGRQLRHGAEEPSSSRAVSDKPGDGNTGSTPSASAAKKPNDSSKKPLASPSVRRRAMDADINLADVPGSGPAGRISQTDLEAWIENQQPADSVERTRTRRTEVEEIKITGLRRKIAERMQQANERITHITYVEEIDVSDLENLREHLNDRHQDRPKLTVLSFLMLAMVQALGKSPKLNSHYDDSAGVLHQHTGIHIGMATQTPGGLMVPVIAHAEARDLWDLASEIARLAEAARSGKAKREELTGSTITLSSLGAMGGIASTPIINLPEVAIIGVNKIVMRQVWRDDFGQGGGFMSRKIMNLSSSFDHRIIDGWDAAVFIQEIKGLVENPATLFMEL